MSNQLVVRWTPGSTPLTGITYQQYNNGDWASITMAQIEKAMKSGRIVHWNPM